MYKKACENKEEYECKQHPYTPPKVENVLGWVACSTRAAGKMPQCLKLLSGGGGGDLVH